MGLPARRHTGPALGRYEVVAPLGRGATSTVYRARDVTTGRAVALKAVPVELGLHGRVEREVRAAALLSHPSLVPILDWGEDDEHLYIVSELVEGAPLDRLLRDGWAAGREDLLCHLVADVLDALEHAHLRGVVHRDVKPANVIVEEDGRGRLTDLGVASVEGDSSLTLTGGIVGTVAYMSPEQALGRVASGASDVYAAALVLYEGLTGRNPILGGGPAEIARRAAAGAVPPVAGARPDAPRRLAQALDLALAKDPATRPTPGALASVLRRAAGEWAGARRRRPRAVRGGQVLASAAGGAFLAGWGAERALHPGLAGVLVAMVAGAAVFAKAPRGATLLTALGGILVLGAQAPGAAVVAGLPALALLAVAPRGAPRAWPLPALAPLLMALGLGPLYAVPVALLRRGSERVWAAVTGVAAVLAWQILAGSGQLGLTSADVAPAARALTGVRDPGTAASRLVEPLRDAPEAIAGAGILVAAILLFPAVARARPGAPRGAAAVAWALGLATAEIALAGAGPVAIEALLPACLLVALWGTRPWRRLTARAGGAPSTSVLHEPAAETGHR